MNDKNLFTIAIILIALAAVYYVYFAPPSDGIVPPDDVILPDKEKFENLLKTSFQIYIAADLRNVQSSIIQTNILQCGVDFMGSEGLAHLEKYFYAFENENCITLENNLTVSECLAEIEDGPTFYIVEGDGTEFYENGAIVGINEEYEYGTCGVILHSN